MRHRKKINHLGRQKSHRKSMLSNMAASLIIHKRIFTTIAKAKALRIFVEPIITKSKQDTTHSRRVVFSYLQDKKAVSELFRDVSVKIGDRPGGYTRIMKTGTRFGDSADMCFIELVDYNQAMLESAEKSDKKTTRRRRGSKKGKTETAEEIKKPVAKKKEEPEVEEVVQETTHEVTEEVAEEVAEEVVEQITEEVAEEVTAEVVEQVNEVQEDISEVKSEPPVDEQTVNEEQVNTENSVKSELTEEAVTDGIAEGEVSSDSTDQQNSEADEKKV